MRLTSFLRALRRCSLPSLTALAAVLLMVTGCGRTDLEEELLLGDGGLPPTVDARQDVSLRDTGAPDVTFFDVTPPPDDVFIPDVFVFDGPFDAPEDAPFDTGSCGDGQCDDGETCTTCPTDCGFCSTCGNGVCDPGESCSSCPMDCGTCESCGDGFCDEGETCVTCPGDCGLCPSCGDGKCNGTENCQNCPSDCGQCAGCGDGHCSQDETCISCPQDCGPCAFCGNNVCDDGETCNSCPQDCGQCPIAETCSQILTCAFSCFQGGIQNFQLSCIADCDANACTQATFFANQATNCLIQAFLGGQCGFGGGMGGALQCAEQACSSQIAACLGSAPCPSSGGSGTGTGG